MSEPQPSCPVWSSSSASCHDCTECSNIHWQRSVQPKNCCRLPGCLVAFKRLQVYTIIVPCHFLLLAWLLIVLDSAGSNSCGTKRWGIKKSRGVALLNRLKHSVFKQDLQTGEVTGHCFPSSCSRFQNILWTAQYLVRTWSSNRLIKNNSEVQTPNVLRRSSTQNVMQIPRQYLSSCRHTEVYDLHQSSGLAEGMGGKEFDATIYSTTLHYTDPYKSKALERCC